MKLSIQGHSITTRSIQPTICVRNSEPAITAILPFVLMRNITTDMIHPCWLTILHRDTEHRLLLNMMGWSMRLENQTPASYASLPHIPIGLSDLTYKSNMVGLYELLKGRCLPDIPDNEGEVFLVKVEYRFTTMTGVWADSKQAAKKLLRKIIQEIDMEANCKMNNVPFASMLDFEQF